MRTPESTIQAAILHPVEEIRTKALAYFARSHTQDETLMPLVIQAVESTAGTRRSLSSEGLTGSRKPKKR